jgi:septum formation protein
MPHLILASSSPHRLRLLREAGYEVEPFPAAIDEPDPARFADLDEGLAEIATLKAKEAQRCGAAGLIVAFDTIGCVGGKVFGKPRDRADARRMLQNISGKMHEVRTGWCLLRAGDEMLVSGVERTTITMRAWSERELAEYLDSGQWAGKSGAYGLTWPDDPFVTAISGSPSNVIGVPLERLAEVLAELGK